MHLALMTSFLYFMYNENSIIKDYACKQYTEEGVVEILIISHIVTAAVSLVYEVAWVFELHSTQAICEIIKIPTYFYVVMYAAYMGLSIIKDEDVGCVDGKLPLHEILIGIELGVYAMWILSTPVFLICAKILGYDSKDEKLVHSGFKYNVAQ